MTHCSFFHSGRSTGLRVENWRGEVGEIRAEPLMPPNRSYGLGPGWRLWWPSAGGWGQVRETATEDLHISSEIFGTFLGERKSVLSTFIVLFHVHISS